MTEVFEINVILDISNLHIDLVPFKIKCFTDFTKIVMSAESNNQIDGLPEATNQVSII